MGFKVAGVLDGALYEVEVTGDATRPVVGSRRVGRLVEQHDGETVLATPVGPAYDVAGADPVSVLALLTARTTVRWVSDDAPKLIDPRPDGTVW